MKFKKISSKYKIKIPTNITVIYCKKKKVITLLNSNFSKSLKLKLKLFFNIPEKLIIVSPITFTTTSNHEKKKIKSIQGTTVVLIKQLLIELTTTIHKKLNFNGVGYRVFEIEKFEKKLLLLKLGFSHFIYFRIPKQVKIFCKKQTQLFISNNSYKNVTQIANYIKSFKKPEPYKGKGILYENEKLVLKEGKKI